MKNKIPLLFLSLGILSLVAGIFFGVLAGFQYILPSFLKEILPFSHLRPLHTTCVIAWIILSATGGVYYYLSKIAKLYSTTLSYIHFILFFILGIGIVISYFSGNFGGKEYLEFPPLLIIPILLGWVLFGINYYKTLIGKIKDWPVYYWMWGTGIVFMIYHLCEAYLWLLHSFSADYIKSLAIQWKAGGSFVGSWNMLVYGTAIYLMAKIKQDDTIGRNRKSFFFYFLGLTNLMFGWAHHIYIVPTETWIRYSAYAISMTEWIILFHMIYEWKKSMPKALIATHFLSYKFLIIADVWVFINIILALLISIPAVNYFTHGTHITVAHSMGTTIGINTSILLASVVYILNDWKITTDLDSKYLGYKILNGSLITFLLALLIAGAYKSYCLYYLKIDSISVIHHDLRWVYAFFLLSGLGIFTGILFIVLPLLQKMKRILITNY